MKMPLDVNEFFKRTAYLTPSQAQACLRLTCYVWDHGSLPASSKHVAAIAGVHPRRWDAMEPLLATFFDHDEDGRWRDYDFDEAREKQSSAKEKAREDGRRGAAVRAENKRKEQEEGRLQTASLLRDSPDDEARLDDQPYADPTRLSLRVGPGYPMQTLRVGLGYPNQTLPEIAGVPSHVSAGSGLTPHGLTDCLDSPIEEENKSVSQSVSRLSTDDSGTCRADASPLAAGIDPRVTPANPDLEGYNSGRSDLGYPKPTLTRDGSISLMEGYGRVVDVANRDAAAAAPVAAYDRPERPQITPSDEEIILAVRAAIPPEKLDPGWRTPETIAKIRTWITETRGTDQPLDLRRHIGAAIGIFAGRMKNPPLRRPACDEIHRIALELCEKDRSMVASKDASGQGPASMVRAIKGQPSTDAWLKFKGVKSFPWKVQDGIEYWLVTTEWPPGSEPNVSEPASSGLGSPSRAAAPKTR